MPNGWNWRTSLSQMWAGAGSSTHARMAGSRMNAILGCHSICSSIRSPIWEHCNSFRKPASIMPLPGTPIGRRSRWEEHDPSWTCSRQLERNSLSSQEWCRALPVSWPLDFERNAQQCLLAPRMQARVAVLLKPQTRHPMRGWGLIIPSAASVAFPLILRPVAEMLAVLNRVALSLMDLHRVSNVARQLRCFSAHPHEALAWLVLKTDF